MPIPAAGWLCAGLVLLAVVLTITQSRAAARHERYVMEQGRPVLGWLVQAPSALFEPGESSRPAQILFTFDPAVADPAALLPEVAARLRALRNRPPQDGPAADAARLVNDHGYRPYERSRLPADLTGGPEVFFAHVYVRRELLPAGVLDVPFVRCRAVPDDEDSRVLMTAYEGDDLQARRPDPEVPCRPAPRSS
jgi:hypothetical protein